MKTLLTGLLLVIASSVNAAVIDFNETTSSRLDTEYQITGENTHVQVIDGEYGLEWLDFGTHDGNDVTFGWSVENALLSYGEQGFRLATETEVSNLFSFFYSDTFVDRGDGAMLVGEDPALQIIQERNSWLVGFGTHEETSGSQSGQELWSTGIYEDDDGTLQMAGFGIFFSEDTVVTTAFLSTDYTMAGLDYNTGYNNMGVFMVRDYIPQVPIPASIWLFGTGLLGLVAVARRRG